MKNTNNQIISDAAEHWNLTHYKSKHLTRIGGVRQANVIVQRKGDAQEPQ